MDGLSIHFDISRIEKLARGLTEKQIEAAWRRALRKTAKWAVTQVARGISKSTGIPQKVVKQRLRVYFYERGISAKIWLGANQISASRLGKLRQTRKGVAVGKFRFDGAFIAKNQVFKRLTKARLPIEKVMVAIDVDSEKVFSEMTSMLDKRLLRVMSQELNFEVHKALKNAV